MRRKTSQRNAPSTAAIRHVTSSQFTYTYTQQLVRAKENAYFQVVQRETILMSAFNLTKRRTISGSLVPNRAFSAFPDTCRGPQPVRARAKGRVRTRGLDLCDVCLSLYE